MHIPVRHLVPAAALALGWLLGTAAPALAQNAIAEEGLFVTVQNPITTDVVQRIKDQVEAGLKDARPVRTVVFDFNPGGKDVVNADFGACYGLAEYIDQRLRASTTTVAFLHGKVAGHTVLPVLACKELVMSKGASLGAVVSDVVPPLKDTTQAIYQAFSAGRKAQFAAVRKMYDPAVELAFGVAKPGGAFPVGTVVYVDRQNKVEAAALGGVKDVTFAPPGQVGLYTADQARELGLCKATAETRTEVAELYNLSPASTEDDPLQGRLPDAYRYTLTGDVDGAMREAVGRIVRDVKARKGNILILTLNCSGGDLGAARALADDLREARTGPDAVRVVAYVPDQAPDAATFIAFGCSDIVMSKRRDAADPNRPEDAREAELGDFSAVVKGGKPGMVDQYRKSLQELAEKRGLKGILVDGMFDPELVIVRAQSATDKTKQQLMSEEAQQADRANWVVVKQVKPRGQLLKLNATLAQELGVARYVVENRDPAGVYALYGLDPAKVKEVTPSWIDRFAEFLRRDVVAVLLVVIGLTGLILELKVPGLTFPGIIAALCFILFFWSQSRFSGEMFVLALLLFLLGLALIGLEIFVMPGFGAPGIFGVMCVLAGLGLVTFERVPQTGDEWGLLGVKLTQYMFGMFVAFGLAFAIARFLPKVPYANRLMLTPPTDRVEVAGEELPGAGEAAGLLGAIGTTSTSLRPAGVVLVADKFVDVVSDGGYVPAGTRVQVIAVEGTRIVVKEV
jgi:membrane-bound ClpP family serine protease